MTDKEIDKRIEKLKKSIAADKADNSWHFIGAPPYIIGADFLDELFERLEGAKSENAALREQLAAAEKRADAAVGALGSTTYPNCSDCIDEGDMTERCSYCKRNPDAKRIGEDCWKWRGETEEEEKAQNEMRYILGQIEAFWIRIKENMITDGSLEVIEKTALNAACECIQVAAMAYKARR